MASYNMRAQIGFPFDSAFPRDIVTINPHYIGDNPQALANTLATNISGAVGVPAGCPFTIKVYDDDRPPPSYPLAEKIVGTGFTINTKPRELALCLSYYSGQNHPRTRGRVYIPGHFIAGALGLRPTATQISDVLSWHLTLGSGLPANHHMVVRSPTNKLSTNVTNFWVDDEWDIMRSRGLKPTTRQTAVP